ncbi:unnamed protein product [Caretta caretta]
MADVIHPDQTYTVPGRSIFDNLFIVRDLLELGHRDGLSFALLSLDQEKVFNRVDHEYLLGTLQAFGFGSQFVSFLRVLYASAECLVRLNWTLTEPVSFGQGVRQGCPLSGQLYALAIEPFLCLLQRRLTGLVLREPELRLVLLAYANDVLLVVQDPGDLAQVEACQAIYSAASSARVNWVKSSGLAVGDWRQVSSLPPALQTIRWSAGPLLYLSFYLSATHPSPPENWQNLEAPVLPGAYQQSQSQGYGYMHQTSMSSMRSMHSQPHSVGLRTYRAMYDYSAQDEDEVSFRDGDYIINVQPIDDGWMYGTVQRTGKTGMLPANYIEYVN